MALPRQLVAYSAIGLLQWLLDSAVMIGLSHAGLAVLLATVAGRIAGACLGYWLNGRYTFAAADNTLHRRSLARFASFWLLSTLLSALVLAAIDHHAGLQMSWLLKPLVDLAAAVAGFLVSRHWIYQSTRQH